MKCTRDWGCTCPACRDRQHPMDIMSRFTDDQKAELGAHRPPDPPLSYRDLCYCGQPGELYAQGSYCTRHAPEVFF